MMEFIRLLIFIKTQENRFSQIKNLKKKKSQIKMVQVWVEWDTGGIGN